MQDLRNKRGWRGWVTLVAGLLGLFCGLCTLFAFVVTAAEGWQERNQAEWPVAMASVQHCSLDVYPYDANYYWIDCSIRYAMGSEQIVSEVHSRTTLAPQRLILQYPAGRFEKMQAWVDAHSEGTPIAVHYDPGNAAKTALIETDMPGAGRRTPGNLKLLTLVAATCAVLLTIARMARPRSPNSSAESGRVTLVL